MSHDRELRALPIVGLPEIGPGAALGELIAASASLQEGDVVVIAQKVVSKSEGRIRRLASVVPGARARRLATELGKDPALVELILAESAEVLRAERGVLIVETHHGFVCANAGIDSSNLPEDRTVSLLPEDPDASARRIRAEIREAGGGAPAVIVADSFGRAWRLGQSEVAIGCAGFTPLDDWRGRWDAHGRELEATLIAVADEAAGVADLVRAKDSQVPAVVVRGLGHFVTVEDGPGASLLRRPRVEDLFR
ncbi:MAG TPA: coenzyme F420-0:L-glutamate ligase [Solirubrobacterales bacterium]|nr:coenzyme F420-0:L-glutamate ligase [Solirubrobacterales bacterium]